LFAGASAEALVRHLHGSFLLLPGRRTAAPGSQAFRCVDTRSLHGGAWVVPRALPATRLRAGCHLQLACRIVGVLHRMSRAPLCQSIPHTTPRPVQPPLALQVSRTWSPGRACVRAGPDACEGASAVPLMDKTEPPTDAGERKPARKTCSARERAGMVCWVRGWRKRRTHLAGHLRHSEAQFGWRHQPPPWPPLSETQQGLTCVCL
jgi:hypothetical protein